MTDAEQPHINRIRAPRSQAVRRGDHIVADGPAAAAHVDGDDLAAVVGLDLPPNVALVDLVAEAGGLLGGTASHHDRLLPRVRLKIAPSAMPSNRTGRTSIQRR